MNNTTTNRVNSIDGIRGFSLFGILLANLLIFQYGLWGKDEIEFFSLSSVDQVMYGVIKIAIEGSFMPIFTFLFGYSLIMMKESLERRKLKVKRHVARRALFLIAIGIVHSTFLWEGDILFFYGLMSFFLLLFLKRKKTTILVWGLVLFGIMQFFVILGSFVEVDGAEEDVIDPETLMPYIERSIDIYESGTYSEIMNFRNNEVPIEEDGLVLLAMVLVAPIFSAPMFLFGMYAAKVKLFLNPKKEKKRYLFGSILLIPVGLFLQTTYFFFPEVNWTQISISMGGTLLSLGYISLFALLYTKASTVTFIKIFENVGKLSMTNYLLQTVICTTIFYGYGLGLFGQLGVTWGILLGIAVFGFQVLCSTLYLKYFRSGPFEKMSRIWTYLTFSGRAKVKYRKEKAAA
ncbi:uncharacterized protein GGQ92_001133 [Gracilibacillus halotolerans]|uniref:DUF418 domain-containing protein n=1 Tax=Gracilibacillus halotolerans TaxID=74386 RepID=A0A841REB2_9BACI|nr:DUF418 domain-containing protein [Gracilibacillus halotolerans]MBB6512350.1 uncharacterized protein [Gracilibacillus halotolerans]